LRTPVFASQLAAGALQQRPGLVVSTHLNFTPVAHWLKRVAGIPYWAVAHGVDAWNIENTNVKQALRQADLILAVSSYTRDRLLKEQTLNPERVVVLPNTFDCDKYQIAPKPKYLLDRYQLKPDQPVILTVARLDIVERCKGYSQILRVLPKVRQFIPNVLYVLVGKGPDRPRIEAMIKELGLESNVLLTGFVPDEELKDYYNLCDVFAMPSKGEGFGIVYLEALACGKPVIGGNQDGAVDALCHGDLGILVNPDDVEAIARSLIEILKGEADHSLIYQPEALRQGVAEVYGYEGFRLRLSDLLQRFHPMVV